MAVTQSFNPPQPGGANISGISMGNNNTVSFMQNSPGATQQTKLEPYMKRDIEEWLDKLVPAAEDLVRSPAHVGDVQQYAERIRGEVVVPEPHRGRVGYASYWATS
jgi:hypothetical protein